MRLPIRQGLLAWIVAVLAIAVFLLTSLHPSDGGVAAVLLYAVGIGSFTCVGALLINRVPANPIGALLLAAGTLLVASIAVGTYADFGALQVPPWPGAAAARLVGNVTFIYPFVLALVGVPLVFPDGRLPSPRFRWVVRIAIADMVAWTILGLLFDTKTGARIAGLAFLEPYVNLVGGFVLVATLISFGAAVYAVVVRFRHGGPIERQQIKWLAADVGLAAVVLPVSLMTTDAYPQLADALSSIAILAMFALPFVIGIAILRYRLYEIDRLISRTIGWAVVTGVSIVVFIGLVIALQTVLAPFTKENTLAVAGSTLVAFALFQPLRRRVQRAVDRRFDRARYDGQRTVDAFAERLRNEVDLGALRVDVATTVQASLRPRFVAIWIRGAGAGTHP